MTRPLDNFRRRLEHGVVLLDGAMGTELERRRVPCPAPLWSADALLTAPDVVQAVHREYVEAGAEVLVANTFRTNPRALRAAHRLADGAALNTIAVNLARRAAGHEDVLVAASVGPVCDCYRPEDAPPDIVLQDEHDKLMIWLARAAPDLIWIETMNNVAETRAAAGAAARHHMPFVLSFVVAEDGNLLSGEPLQAAVAAAEQANPLALGLNCVPPRGLTALLPHLRRLTARPLAAYAHIGNAEPIRGWSYGQAAMPAEYAEWATGWIAGGAAAVGGCCGTTPGHIAALRDRLRKD